MPSYTLGTYVGRARNLQGKTALLRPSVDPRQWLAQFDDMHVSLGGTLLGHGWHVFAREDFKIQTEGELS